MPTINNQLPAGAEVMDPYYKYLSRGNEKKNPDHDIFPRIQNGHLPITQQKCCPLQNGI